MWLPREPARHAAAQRDGAGRGSIGAPVRNRRLIATCGVGFCVLFTQVAMFTYVTFHLAAPPFSLSTVALGWLFVVYLVGAVVTPFAGRWIDRYGHRTGIALGDGDRRRRRAADAGAVAAGDRRRPRARAPPACSSRRRRPAATSAR